MLSALMLSMLMIRSGSRTVATSKNRWKPLTIITKRPILDVAAVLDPPLMILVSTLNENHVSYVQLWLNHVSYV